VTVPWLRHASVPGEFALDNDGSLDASGMGADDPIRLPLDRDRVFDVLGA